MGTGREPAVAGQRCGWIHRGIYSIWESVSFTLFLAVPVLGGCFDLVSVANFCIKSISLSPSELLQLSPMFDLLCCQCGLMMII